MQYKLEAFNPLTGEQQGENLGPRNVNRLRAQMRDRFAGEPAEYYIPQGTPGWAAYGSLPARALTHMVAQPLRDIGGFAEHTGNVLQGQEQPDLGKVLGMAGAMAGGGTMFNTAPAGSLGMFIGPRHPAWDWKAYRAAEKSLRGGADRRDVWADYMNYRDPGGNWWQEISDMEHAQPMGDVERTTLGQVVPHPNLYQGDYAFMKDMLVIPYDEPGYMHAFNPKSRYMALTDNSLAGFTPTQIAHHEMQHAVADIEGGPKGATPVEVDEFTPGYRPNETAFDRYQRSAGEAQANATMRRWGWDMDQRRAVYPEDSMRHTLTDQLIPMDQQFVERAPYNKGWIW